MIARGQCWTCCRRQEEALCDGRKPTCARCETARLECLGYYGADGLRGTDDAYAVPNQQTETPPSSVEEKPLPDAIRQSPETPLYRRAQMIFEGLEYCVFASLESLESLQHPP